MSRFGNTWEVYLQLYGEGGLTVCMKRAGGADQGAADELIARSVIQPDADVIHVLAPELLRAPALLEMHLGAVRARMMAARRLRSALRVLRLGALLPAAFAAYHLVVGACEVAGCGAQLPGGDPLPVVAGLASSGLMVGTRGLATRWLRWRIRRRLSSVLAEGTTSIV